MDAKDVRLKRFMDNNIVIRRAGINDLKEIYGIICELENEQLDFIRFALIYNKNITNSEYAYLVASVDDKIIGFISYHTQNLLHHCGCVGEVQEFFIDSKYRNRGIGKMLMKEINRISSINEIVSIEVTSNKKRTDNVIIYERLGFNLTHNKFTKVFKTK